MQEKTHWIDLNEDIDMKNSKTNYDVFISYASEDKTSIALPLAKCLKNYGIKVWIDEFELTMGDSLRQRIDKGLLESRFGLVILSPMFFKKEWPKKELNGLIAREDGKAKVILPVWHNLGAKEIKKYSPILADRVAVSTNCGIEDVAKQVLQVIRQESEYHSTLLQEHTSESSPKNELTSVRQSETKIVSKRIPITKIVPIKFFTKVVKFFTIKDIEGIIKNKLRAIREFGLFIGILTLVPGSIFLTIFLTGKLDLNNLEATILLMLILLGAMGLLGSFLGVNHDNKEHNDGSRSLDRYHKL